ncbi:MAG: valine--tRNA ligase [Firmicutes bacterium]|nr:valine--tRNA ligase [Bacillota bacterium]
MEQNLAKTYNPKEFEDRIYEMWEEKGAFRAEINSEKEPFTIVMPPPNITGQLHIGHALDHTLQDVLIRWKRLQGFPTLWLPGSDHASIATEVKVVEQLKSEGLDKETLGREKFLERVWDWKREYGGRITKQCRKLGDSCDWSRERFTMDEGCNKAVRHFFVELYNKGLIYRGNRLINWCPTCGTSLSDAEVEHEDKQGKYWYFRYPAANGEGDGIVVATSRPETMFGDVAIAVHPSDERYKDLIGTNVVLPLVGREIPIIADEYPDPEKGTGAVKITPAHDPNDFEVGRRANLESLSCINPDATMNDLAGKYSGMDRYECRKAWVSDLEEAGYLVKTEELTIPVGECYRCHTVIEPMLSDQWFVKMTELAKPAIETVKTGDTIFVPERFDKVYYHWLEDIKDWCISRQLWWGHRIPVWYCEDCGEMICAEDDPEACPKCGSKNLKQDEDVLDTWFSSALWPFSTMGWPEETEDLKYFYPTSVLVTGYDILFFWVVRMVFAGIECTGKSPFKYVYYHGIVRDHLGRKMSKSLNNGIDPLEAIDQYGADALRFMLLTGITPGNDMRYTTEKIEAARNFANKLWNASRFVIMNIKGEDGDFLDITKEEEILSSNLREEDKWIISRLWDATDYVNKTMEKFDISLAGQRVYDLIWNEFCDWYIELVKKRLWGDNEEDKKVARGVLVYVLKSALKLLHPFMPFITEEIWGFMPDCDTMLINSSWPVVPEGVCFERESSEIEFAMEAIKAIREMRVESECAPSKKLDVVFVVDSEKQKSIENIEQHITDIGNLSNLSYCNNKDDAPKDAMSAVLSGAELYIPMEDLIDFDAEFERLTKEEKRLKDEVKRAEGKLSNEGFVNKAPQKIIDEEKAKLDEYKDMLLKVQDRLAVVSGKISK